MNYVQLNLIRSLFFSIFIYESYSKKPFHFNETKIYAELYPKDANTAHFYHLKSSKICSQWNYLS